MKKILERFRLIIILSLFAAPLLYVHASENAPSTFIEKFFQKKETAVVLSQKNLSKAFYAKRRNDPAWQLADRNAKETVENFIAFVQGILTEHGLSSAKYPFATLRSKVAKGSEKELLEADILATDIVMQLANSLSGQDASPQSKNFSWPVKRPRLDLAGALNKAVDEKSVAEFLEALAPKTPKYQRLLQALADYRAIADKGGWIKLPPRSASLKSMDRDDRVPMLHQRLAQEGYLPFDAARYQNPVYDAPLEEAVKRFQKMHGLKDDGLIGSETIRAFNVSVKERIDQIRVNLARIRLSPNDVWENIVINIPAAQLNFYRGGEEVYAAPVVVGRIDRPTPLVASQIYEMVINPPWYVPRSIAEKDILPKLQDNPDYLESIGISVRGEDGGDIASRLRQKPGPGNSLGRLKFNFHNSFAVYLHGSPHTELFDRDDRTRSSGCVRLEKPDDLAMIFLQGQPDWDAEKLKKKIDSVQTIAVKNPNPVPVKLLYWTVMVDREQNVLFYNDIYGLDREWLNYL